MTDILRKPSEWATLDNIRILDPDGWRSPNEKDFEIPISREEWYERSRRCTVQRLPTCYCGKPSTQRWCADCFARNQRSAQALLSACSKQHRGAGGAAICICGAGCGGSEACNGLNLLKAALRGDAALRASTLRVFGWDLC